MEFLNIVKNHILKKSFLLILFLTLLLYGFSYRFSLLLYVIPVFFYLMYCLFKREYKAEKRTFILFAFLTIYGLLIFIGGLIDLDFSVRLKASTYIFLFFLPVSYIFYNEIRNNKLEITYNNLLLTYSILGYLIFILYYNGFIAGNRYQHVGNIMAGLIILLFGLKTKKLKWTLILLTLFLLLLTGSRQAVVGLVFVGLLYLTFSNIKVVLYAIIVGFIIYLNWEYIFDKIDAFAFENNIETLKRLVFAMKNNGGASVQVRFSIYENLLNQIKVLPNLEFSPNKDSLLPHNFFLEYAVTCGYLISIFFVIFILYSIFKVTYYNKNNILVYFSVFYFVTFNVSSGITSAKYFLYYCLLLFVIQFKSVRQ